MLSNNLMFLKTVCAQNLTSKGMRSSDVKHGGSEIKCTYKITFVIIDLNITLNKWFCFACKHIITQESTPPRCNCLLLGTCISGSGTTFSWLHDRVPTSLVTSNFHVVSR